MTSGFWQKTGKGLAKTRHFLSAGLGSIFKKKREIDQDTFDRLEALLIGADLGVEVTQVLLADLKASVERKEVGNLETLRDKLKTSLIEILKQVPVAPPIDESPIVTLFVGVNGVGKTTTIGKHAKRLCAEGKKVLLAAADTFRAGAGEQLSIWGQRAGAEVIRFPPGADPSAVVFDATSAAMARKVDHLLIDTAGRLQTKHNLMEELKKMTRVISKQIPNAPHEKILVLDATTGQNALSQAEHFQKAIGLTGIVLTKLDGTGRGGIVVPIVQKFSVPIIEIGVGESPEDLIPFDIENFVGALFEEENP